ncbi:MAG: aspartate kinase [Candidatus Woesearchaeota archaeon]
MIIQKYGGSSVKDAERIKNVCNIIKNTFEKIGSNPNSLIVVSSAAGGITDMLISYGKEPGIKESQKIFDEIKNRHIKILKGLDLDESLLDSLLNEILEIVIGDMERMQFLDIMQSFGERMSTRIISAYLNKIGIKSTQHDAYDIGFVTDDNFGNAEILPETYDLINKKMSKFEGVPVVTGFIAKTRTGDITTLGRGGSDYSAAIIGAALSAEEVQIWTDVNGIMTADPRMIKEAKTVPVVSFSEASELAYFGAKVLHPKTILPLMDKEIPVRILNTYEPDHEGTLIVKKLNKSNINPHKALAFKKDIQIINVTSTRMLNAHGFLAKLFETFEKYRIVIDMITTSEVSVSVTADPGVDLDKVVRDLSEFSIVEVRKNRSLICCVGEVYKYTPGILSKILTLVANEGINVEMIGLGASEINVSFVVDSNDLEKCVRALHKGLYM